MTREEAKAILALYRPGIDDADEPALVEALALANVDPELRRWWKDQAAVYASLRQKFKDIPVPAGLENQILVNPGKRHPWWYAPIIWAAAAAIIIAVGLTFYQPNRLPEHSFFAFRAKMVRTAMGNYPMPFMTNDLTAIRSYLTTNNAHGDYTLTPAMAKLPGQGCVILPWHRRTTSLICLDGGKGKDVFLFVINRADLSDPPVSRQSARLGNMNTISWSDARKTYVLASKGDEQFLKSLL